MADDREGENGKINVVVKTSKNKEIIEAEATATILKFKELVSIKFNAPVSQLCLIFAGRILKDGDTLASYSIKDGLTVHLVIKSDNRAQQQAAQHASGQQQSPSSTPVTSSASNPPSQSVPSFQSGMEGLGGLDMFGNSGNIHQMSQQLMSNPEMLRQMMDNPMVQNMMSNPDLIRQMILSNPQMQQIIERNPEISHILNNPDLMRQTMEMVRNPSVMQEMMRTHDRALSNLEWPVMELKQINREARKIVVESGGRHPCSSNALLYMPRSKGGQGLHSVEMEYKATKIKGAVRLHGNEDRALGMVREFEEQAERMGRRSIFKEAATCAEELGLKLDLEHVQGIKKEVRRCQIEKLEDEIRNQRWQGHLVTTRLEDESLSASGKDGAPEDESLSADGCFWWLTEWNNCPSHTIAGLAELYEQLLPTPVYTSQKTHTSGEGEVRCKLCGKAPESVAHILSGCSALAQSKYLSRHDTALKVLFYRLLYNEGFIDEIPPWYSLDKPKPVYESENVKAYWDVPIYADQQEVRCNRVDACIVNHMCKGVVTLEMSCPWVNNWTRKDEEKTLKYGPLRWELRQQFPGYEVKQYNIIMDALGGWSQELDVMMRKLVGGRSTDVLRKMQRTVLSGMLNIAWTFKSLPGGFNALQRMYTDIQEPMLNATQEQDMLDILHNVIHTGLNILMPVRRVRVNSSDVPWMTPHLKSLILKRQRAFREHGVESSSYKLYRNAVNRERKSCKASFYKVKVEHMKEENPKLWWKEVKLLSGSQSNSGNVINHLYIKELEDCNNHELANIINQAFLEPLEEYRLEQPLSKFPVSADSPKLHEVSELRI
ncbi:Ubiquilin-1 [Stylophora pistillata]|uniref:Ubiquilin-1 n=1 Tax=Stylophora pistillata TaxID=50429 RepID=A0A2B4T045_STYPI|nr:Ubiquilin-1 [Stylophora pistillata]